jgi:hypothetical protein
MQLDSLQIAFICDDRNDVSAIRHPNLQNMFVIQVGEKIAAERCDIRVDSPAKVGVTLSRLLEAAPPVVPQDERTLRCS